MEILKSSDDHDLNSVAWGIYNVFIKQFGYGEGYRKKRNSIFPTYILIAGKILKSIKDNELGNICRIKEFPYTLQELNNLESDVNERKIKMGKVLFDFATNKDFTIEDYNAYSAEVYNELKKTYHHLSKDDMDGLHEYCLGKAKSELWTSSYPAYRKLKEKMGKHWKY